MTEPTEKQLLDKTFWQEKSTSSDNDDLQSKRVVAIKELRNLHHDHENTDLTEVGTRVAITHEAHLLIDLIDQYDRLIALPF